MSKQKKEKLIDKNFRNKRGDILANGDLYKCLFDRMVDDSIQIVHLPGHMPSKLMDQDNKLFSELDKLVRKKLRSHC